ncbi:hypothetical protein [Candidatus Nitrosocosmicus sp. R]
MPIKMSKKGGGTKKRSFDEGVVDLKKQGKSEESARKIRDQSRKNKKAVVILQKRKRKVKNIMMIKSGDCIHSENGSKLFILYSQVL